MTFLIASRPQKGKKYGARSRRAQNTRKKCHFLRRRGHMYTLVEVKGLQAALGGGGCGATRRETIVCVFFYELNYLACFSLFNLINEPNYVQSAWPFREF